MKTGVWSRDWFAGLAFSFVFFLLAYLFLSDGFQGLERYAYDIGVRSRQETPSDRVAVIAIDDESIRNLGRWPWPRNLHAAMLDLLREGGAKVVGNTVLYFEEQTDPGLRYINELTDLVAKSSLAGDIPAEIQTFGVMLDDLASRAPAAAELGRAYKESKLVTQYEKDISAVASKLVEANQTLSMDRVLADAMGKTRTILAMGFELGYPQGKPDQAVPDYVRKSAITRVVDRVEAKANEDLPLPTIAAQVPIAALGQVAAGIGHLHPTIDVDGARRFEALVLEHYGEYFPSMSLLLAGQALNLGPGDIELRLGEGVALGNIDIRTDRELLMNVHFYRGKDGRPPFTVDSFFDVYSGKVPVANYRDKVVLIGATAQGVGDSFSTPVDQAMTPVLTLAHTVASVLGEDFYVRPEWAIAAELGLFLLVALYVAFAVPAMGPGLGALITIAFIALLVGAQLYLMAGMATWVKFMTPVLLLATGHLFMTIKRLRLTEKLKLSSDAESSEGNKMYGLALQGQGQLDAAFDRFRRVQPVDDKVLDLLYNLALDYERKRQFNKAESVYQHIAQHNKDFKDVAQKVARAKKLSETVILGGAAAMTSAGGTMILDAGGGSGIEKPMLGRYQVEKELGKGAMGVVYMGRDPKINRVVAIKTMALSQEFEPDELEEVKGRFFREAETAGRLNHRNIVTIFDAGEEHDLCYIAMEFLKGHDLVRYTKPANLMPVADALRHIADCADALDFAHAQNVVHRDIKPANIMYLEDAKLVKLTDFGIARITDSSKTKTGMVLGTPSYMSPEQLAGKKVDGRSDLFSLGVTLYQLLTGTLPFQAESMATLMFKITNEPHATVTMVRPDLPAPLGAAVDKALHKDAAQRYQRGADLARELRAILAGMGTA